MGMLKIGIIGTSKKQNEKRMPIHPDHLGRIPKQIRQQLYFEMGYGEAFGLTDEELGAQVGGIASRQELMGELGAVVVPKPIESDLLELKKGGILWGWPHCVQQKEITQIAVDRKLSIIAFEEMFVWDINGNPGRHTFYKNNELAGYCGVLHALQLKGLDGHYGDQRKVVIISFGAVSRGAIYALKARGFLDITICIQRPDHQVREEVLGCHYIRIKPGDQNKGEARMMMIEHDGSSSSLLNLIGKADIVVNGIFQDPNQPFTFVNEGEVGKLKKGCLIIDISCDEGMGFSFAKPTTFKDPILKVRNINYYAVDHTPSYLWESATRCISAALIVHLASVVQGRDNWQTNETIRRAIEIDRGVIQKSSILSFQNRESEYPHNTMS